MASRMRWNLFLPTPERIRSPIINTKDFGSLILLNIKGDIVKPDERDEVQLAAQVLCLEEMYGIHIPRGALYYDEVKRRETVEMSDVLRTTTMRCAKEMHRIFTSGDIPKATKRPHCKNCSLKDICLPETNDCTQVVTYLSRNLYENIT